MAPCWAIGLPNVLPLTFGVTSMALGVVLIVKIAIIPAVVLAILAGSFIGEMCRAEDGIRFVAGKIRKVVDVAFPKKGDVYSQEEFMDRYVALIVTFCVSGTGIFGAMNEGMTGDPSLLIAKALLDLFTAWIFAATLGYSVAVIAIPQFLIQIVLLLGAKQILPLVTPQMVGDFSACGGVIMLATGFCIAGIKSFPIANMLPALALVMPISFFWAKVA